MKITDKDLQRAAKAKLEYMREQVQEMELQARYWKAQYESKYYTLQDSKILEEYNEFLTTTQEAYAKQIEAEAAASVDTTAEVEADLLTSEEAPL